VNPACGLRTAQAAPGASALPLLFWCVVLITGTALSSDWPAGLLAVGAARRAGQPLPRL
jgi:hypothetical protein